MTTKNQAVASIDEMRARASELKQSGQVMADVARECGISESQLSQFIAGTYRGNNQKAANKLASWFASSEARKTLPVMPEFVETPSVKNIWSAFQYAQLTKTIAVVYGHPGLSKTTAKDMFVASHPNVWPVTISRSSIRVAGCLFAIAQAVGVDEPNVYRPDMLYRQVRAALSNTKGLLIIDEADRLGYDTLEELRILQEESGVGMVLIGNHQVYKRMTGNETRNVDFARLFSRIARRVVIEKATQADIDAIINACDLDEPSRPVVEWLARQAGALRTVFFTLQLASAKAMASKQPLTRAHIVDAITELGSKYLEVEA